MRALVAVAAACGAVDAFGDTCDTNARDHCIVRKRGAADTPLAPGPGDDIDAFLKGDLAKPPCELPTLDYGALNATEIRRIVKENRPVMFTNVSVLREGSHDWSKADFLSRFGHLKLAGNSPETRDGDELSALADVENATHPPRFFMQTDRGLYGDLMRHLREDLSDEPAHLYSTVANGPVLSIAGAGTWNRIHKHGRAWQAQLHGAKLWWLAPKSNRQGVIPETNLKDVFGHWGSNVCGYMQQRPMTSSMYCLNTPGHLIFVPMDYFHGTCNLDEWTLAYGMEGKVKPMVRALLFEDVKGYDIALGRCVAESASNKAAGGKGRKGGKGGTKDKCSGRISEFGSPLATAAAHGHVKMVDHLMKQLQNEAKRTDKKRQTPAGLDKKAISQAIGQGAKMGHRSVAEFFLQAVGWRKEVQAILKEPCTVAIAAGGGTGSVPVMQLLLEQRASMTKPCDQMPPLMHAVTSYDGGNAMVDFLEKQGADSRTNKLFVKAASSGHFSITKHLSRHHLPTPSQPMVDAALRSACAQGHSRIVELLLDMRALPTSKDSKGKTAIEYAIQPGMITLMRMLVPHNASGILADVARAAASKVDAPIKKAEQKHRDQPHRRVQLRQVQAYLKNRR